MVFSSCFTIINSVSGTLLYDYVQVLNYCLRKIYEGVSKTESNYLRILFLFLSKIGSKVSL